MLFACETLPSEYTQSSRRLHAMCFYQIVSFKHYQTVKHPCSASASHCARTVYTLRESELQVCYSDTNTVTQFVRFTLRGLSFVICGAPVLRFGCNSDLADWGSVAVQFYQIAVRLRVGCCSVLSDCGSVLPDCGSVAVQVYLIAVRLRFSFTCLLFSFISFLS